jgi:hypothetical protein
VRKWILRRFLTDQHSGLTVHQQAHMEADSKACEYMWETSDEAGAERIFKREYRRAWWFWFSQVNIGPVICRLRGHRCETECGGDAESGPITDTTCVRCGWHKRTFGM